MLNQSLILFDFLSIEELKGTYDQEATKPSFWFSFAPYGPIDLSSSNQNWIMNPITSLQKKGKKFVWDEKCEDRLNKLK